LNSSHTG